MKKKLTVVVLCVYSVLTAVWAKPPTEIQDSKSILAFNIFEKTDNYSSSMFFTGIDIGFFMFANEISKFLPINAKPIVTAPVVQALTVKKAVYAPEIIFTEKICEIPLPSGTTWAYVRKVKGNIFLYCTLPNRMREENCILQLRKNRLIGSVETDCFAIERGWMNKCVGISSKNPEIFCEVDGSTGKKIRSIQLPARSFPRRVTALQKGRYLLFSHVFTPEMPMFSILDIRGKKIADFSPARSNMLAKSRREYFLRELCVMNIGKEGIYIAPMYPQQAKFNVQIFSRNGNPIRVFSGEIENYSGFPDILYKSDLRVAKTKQYLDIASINGIFEGKKHFFIAIGRNDVTKDNARDLVQVYRLDGSFLGEIKANYGVLAYYDQEQNLFYSIHTENFNKKLVVWKSREEL